MPRTARASVGGICYHVINGGNTRQEVFRKKGDYQAFIDLIDRACERIATQVLGYRVMPNHYLLLETPEGNLSRMMQAFQTSYTVYFNRRHSRTGHVFEQRYKALLVDRDNYLLQVSWYIHLNPVAARVVERPQDYRWSSYRAYVDWRGNEKVSREVILEQLGGRGKEKVLRYREFVEESLKRGEAWDKIPVIRQAFVGEEEFAERVIRKVRKREGLEERYSLAELAQAVSKVMGLRGQELKRSVKDATVQTGRELLMYLARRHSGASLAEVAAHLGLGIFRPLVTG